MTEDVTIYTVAQLNEEVKDLLDAVPGYRNIYVRGEISNYKAHSSGHHYMTLKDESAAIKAVMFRREAMRLKFRPANGMKVIVRGRVSSFPRTGEVQLYLSEIVPEGAGALHLAFEQLKARLQMEGLFDQARKKPLPRFPKRIALVTSPTGKAVHDMLRILRRRWPVAKVTVYPALVQGDDAPASISRALALVNALHSADVILCGRGGGSLEDLWSFNTEQVARAIAASNIPVVSAVGHEPDYTIADFVADLRAPTPSGAAELVSPDRFTLLLSLRQMRDRLCVIANGRTMTCRQRLEALFARLEARTPRRYIEEKRLLLDHLNERLSAAIVSHLEREKRRTVTAQRALLEAHKNTLRQERTRFIRAAAALDALSPLKVLGRGYAIATDKGGAVISDAAQIETGAALYVRFAKGAAECRVVYIRKGEDHG